MKRYIIISLCILLSFNSKAQTNTNDALSIHIADKMKAALNLSTEQYQQIVKLNQQLQQQKQQVRLHFPSADALGKKLQQVEQTRDKLYEPILGEEKYVLYKQKKVDLINNN